jgi:hypothetical protein
MRFIVIAAAVLAANAMLSFAYTKDDVMSPAGVFYALAAFAAMREALSVGVTGRAATAVMVMLAILSTGWAIRTAGVHYVLRSQAIKHQVDWVDLPGRWRRNGEWPDDKGERRLILQLRRDAVRLAVPNTRVDIPEWPARLWSE